MSQFHDMKTTKLQKKEKELRKQLIKHKAEAATGTVPEDSGKIRTVKRTIARIKTELNARQEESNN